MKRYLVTLTDEERGGLEHVIGSGNGAARKLRRAGILLKADCGPGGPDWDDTAIAESLEVGIATVERTGKQFVEQGVEATLIRRRPQRQYQGKLDGDAEAHLIGLACGEAPPGQGRWTLGLLADQMVALEYVDTVSHEAVRQTLKKTSCSRGGRSSGAFRLSKIRSSPARWKTFSTCIECPTTGDVRKSARTRRASS